MKFNSVLSLLSLFTVAYAKASRSEFYGENDIRPELFKILDDKIGTFKITLSDEEWKAMKENTLYVENDPNAYTDEKFGTSNASLEFSVEGTDYKVELQPGDFNFRLGGHYTRYYSKPGYNIKLEKGSIFGGKNLRLRSMANDPSFMREKISTDILYKLGLPTTSTNYANVEVNGEYLGLYVITDKVKKDLIKRYFGDAKTNNLYECQNDVVRFEDNTIANYCINANDEIADNKEDIQRLVDAVNLAQTVDDVKDILDIDSILKVYAFEFITIATDNSISYCHNYSWYKKADGKWMIIINDFNKVFAQDVWVESLLGNGQYVKKTYFPSLPKLNYANISIRDFDIGHKITKLLIHDDDTRWREIIAEVVKTVFNPAVLNARIDEIADLIRDDLAVTREINEDGYQIGSFNTLGYNPTWNMTQFEGSINYTHWVSAANAARSFGLKFFIEERVKYLCHTYGINPETYELIQPRPVVSYWSIKNKYAPGIIGDYYSGVAQFTYPDLEKEDYYSEEYNANPEKNSTPYFKVPLTVHEQGIELCWSHKYGYPCCSAESCHVYESDENGDWGYENGRWCGIQPSCGEEECWAKKYGYGCCKRCFIYDVTDEGKWGFEDGEWCGILDKNCK